MRIQLAVLAGFLSLGAQAQVLPTTTFGDLEHCAIQPDRAQITAALDTLRGRERFEPLTWKNNNSLPFRNDPLPGLIQEQLDVVTAAVTARTGFVKVYEAGRAGDTVRFDYSPDRMAMVFSSKIWAYYAKSFKGDELKHTIAYVLAHELSHYFQDLFQHERILDPVPVARPVPGYKVGGIDEYELAYPSDPSIHLRNTLWHAQTDALAAEIMRRVPGFAFEGPIRDTLGFAQEFWRRAAAQGIKATTTISSAQQQLLDLERRKSDPALSQKDREKAQAKHQAYGMAVFGLIEGVIRTQTLRAGAGSPDAAKIDLSRCYEASFVRSLQR